MGKAKVIRIEDQEFVHHKANPNRIVKIITLPEFGGPKGVAVGITVCQSACKGMPPHVHPNSDEIMVVTHGVGKFIVDGEEYVLREGEAIIVPAGTPHGYEALDPATPFEFVWIYNDPKDAKWPEEYWTTVRKHALRGK